MENAQVNLESEEVCLQPIFDLPKDLLVQSVASKIFNSRLAALRSEKGYARERELEFFTRRCKAQNLKSVAFRAALRELMNRDFRLGEADVHQDVVQLISPPHVMQGARSYGPEDSKEKVRVDISSSEYVAHQLSGLAGAPKFNLIWSQNRRTQALKAIRVWLSSLN